MYLCRLGIEEVIATRQRVIGFWGAPPPSELAAASLKYPGVAFFDLDVFHDAPTANLVPPSYCHVIRNCIDNALFLGDRLVAVVAATGDGKCDAGRYAAAMLAGNSQTDVIVPVDNRTSPGGQPLLCEARGSLRKRITRIMDAIVEPLSEVERSSAFMSRSTPTVGFWGTPPHPIEVLDLFPDTTHIFGWTRCVEQGAPADLSLEMQVANEVPTVFFSQGYCPKALLARELATRHDGIHVELHESLDTETLVKIEEFIRSGVLKET